MRRRTDRVSFIDFNQLTFFIGSSRRRVIENIPDRLMSKYSVVVKGEFVKMQFKRSLILESYVSIDSLGTSPWINSENNFTP